MEESNLLFGGAGEVDEGRVEGFDAAAREIFEKAAQSDKMVSLGDGL